MKYKLSPSSHYVKRHCKRSFGVSPALLLLQLSKCKWTIKFCYWSKGLMKIDSFSLCKSLDYLTCLILLFIAFSSLFDLEHSFASHQILFYRKLHNWPRAIKFKCLNFFDYGCTPLWFISDGLRVRVYGC